MLPAVGTAWKLAPHSTAPGVRSQGRIQDFKLGGGGEGVGIEAPFDSREYAVRYARRSKRLTGYVARGESTIISLGGGGGGGGGGGVGEGGAI